MYIPEKYALRRRLAVNLGSKSADSSPVEYSRTLPLASSVRSASLYRDGHFVSNIARKSLRYGKI